MSKSKTVRVASGSHSALFSCVWRIIVSARDVYLGASKASMGLLKFSLHESGVWTFAATKQSTGTFADGNRRAKKWLRPPEHVPGVTRGPSIVVPYTSLGSRPFPPDEVNDAEVIWFDIPAYGEAVEFSVYFVRAGYSPKWSDACVELARMATDEGALVILGTKWMMPKDLVDLVGNRLLEATFEAPRDKKPIAGFVLSISETIGKHEIPVVLDLPLPIRTRDN